MNNLDHVKLGKIALEAVEYISEDPNISQIELVAIFGMAGQIVTQSLTAKALAANLHNLMNN